MRLQKDIPEAPESPVDNSMKIWFIIQLLTRSQPNEPVMRIAWSFSGLHDFWKRSHPVVELAALKAFKAVECQVSGKRSKDLENTNLNMSYMNACCTLVTAFLGWNRLKKWNSKGGRAGFWVTKPGALQLKALLKSDICRKDLKSSYLSKQTCDRPQHFMLFSWLQPAGQSGTTSSHRSTAWNLLPDEDQPWAPFMKPFKIIQIPSDCKIQAHTMNLAVLGERV